MLKPDGNLYATNMLQTKTPASSILTLQTDAIASKNHYNVFVKTRLSAFIV